MKRNSIIIAFILLLSSAAIAQQNDCHLMMDKAVEGKRIKATKRTSLVEMTDFGMGVMLQNYTGNMTMVLDIAINGKRITKNFNKNKQCTLGFVLKNGAVVTFDIKEAKAGSGAHLQSWGNYEIGSTVDVRKGQNDTLQQAPISAMLFSFYGLPNDTISTFSNKEYFVKNLPCIKIEQK